MPRRRRGASGGASSLMLTLAGRMHNDPEAPQLSACYPLNSVEVIAIQDADSEGHFVGDCRRIAIAAFAKLPGCVMSDPELHAPESNGPSAHTEFIGDVFLKHAVSFQSAEKLSVRAAMSALSSGVSPSTAISVYCAAICTCPLG